MSQMFVKLFYKSSILKISNKILNIGSGKPHSVNFLVSLIGGKKFL